MGQAGSDLKNRVCSSPFSDDTTAQTTKPTPTPQNNPTPTKDFPKHKTLHLSVICCDLPKSRGNPFVQIEVRNSSSQPWNYLGRTEVQIGEPSPKFSTELLMKDIDMTKVTNQYPEVRLSCYDSIDKGAKSMQSTSPSRLQGFIVIPLQRFWAAAQMFTGVERSLLNNASMSTSATMIVKPSFTDSKYHRNQTNDPDNNTMMGMLPSPMGIINFMQERLPFGDDELGNPSLPEPGNQINLDVVLKAAGLKKLGIFSPTNPFCVLHVRFMPDGSWDYIGRTEVLQNNLNPNFQRRLGVRNIDSTKMTSQYPECRFSFYSADNKSMIVQPTPKDKCLGVVTVPLKTIMSISQSDKTDYQCILKSLSGKPLKSTVSLRPIMATS